MIQTLTKNILIRTVSVIICAGVLMSCGLGAFAAETGDDGGETGAIATEDTPGSTNPPEDGSGDAASDEGIPAGESSAEATTGEEAVLPDAPASEQAAPESAPSESTELSAAGDEMAPEAAEEASAAVSAQGTVTAQATANPQSSGYYSPTSPFGGIAWPVGCTRYAWGRAYEKLGVRTPVKYSAGSWIREAQAAGVPTGMAPQSNSIAVWTGHVAFVESVSGDSVYLTEGGWSPGNGNYQGNPYWHEETTSAGVMVGRHGQALLGYIYVGTLASASQPAKVSKVKLNVTSRTLTVGKTLTLKASVSPKSATNKKLSWKSSNAKVAKVTAKGSARAVVKAKKSGKATIIARAKDGSNKKATCKVYVGKKVKSVKLKTTAKTLKKGQSFTIKKTISPKSAANKRVSWKSSKPKVARVNSSGRVKALKKGKATITCTTQDGKKKARCTIYVGKPVTSLKLNAKTKALKAGESFTLRKTLKPASATLKAVTWSTSSKKVATVKNGRVTARAAGRATITCTSKDGGKKARCTVTVSQPVTSVSLSTPAVTLAVGKSMELRETIQPSAAGSARQVWTSSAPAVAAVNNSGVVSAKAVGKTTVSITAGEKSAKCVVTVTKAAA